MIGKKKILIVEDNAACRELLAVLFQRKGYEIIEATTGLEALDRAHSEGADIIVMDLGLPGMPGDEVTARLKMNPVTKDIPIIVNTAYPPNSPEVQRARVAGALEVLHKPVRLKVFEELVSRYLPSDSDAGTSNPSHHRQQPLHLTEPARKDCRNPSHHEPGNF